MKKHKLRIVNKFKFICSLVFILLVLLVVINITFKISIAEGTEELKYVEMHIKTGDTIWGIAKKFTPQDKDIRKTIHEISSVNKLCSFEIYPGQIIKIPVQ
ncbi:LysM peptidoglycan-binding domain-containing protein [Clostridiaceae bacterium 35-E11]